MKPGDTVITPGGKEGKVNRMRRTEWLQEHIVWVDFLTPNKYWKVYLESELKVKEEKK